MAVTAATAELEQSAMVAVAVAASKSTSQVPAVWSLQPVACQNRWLAVLVVQGAAMAAIAKKRKALPVRLAVMEAAVLLVRSGTSTGGDGVDGGAGVITAAAGITRIGYVAGLQVGDVIDGTVGTGGDGGDGGIPGLRHLELAAANGNFVSNGSDGDDGSVVIQPLAA